MKKLLIPTLFLLLCTVAAYAQPPTVENSANQRWGWHYDQAWVRCMMAESSDYVFRADEKTAAGAHYLVYMTKDETRAVSFLMADGGVAEQIYWFGAGATNAEQWMTRYFVARGPDEWVDAPNNARIRRVRTADYVSYTVDYERFTPQ